MRVFGYFVATLIGILLSYFYGAWALTVLWAWFIGSTFHVTALSLGAAMGLTIVINYIKFSVGSDTYYKTGEKRPYSETLTRLYTWAIIAPSLSLGLGWLVHTFLYGRI